MDENTLKILRDHRKLDTTPEDFSRLLLDNISNHKRENVFSRYHFYIREIKHQPLRVIGDLVDGSGVIIFSEDKGKLYLDFTATNE